MEPPPRPQNRHTHTDPTNEVCKKLPPPGGGRASIALSNKHSTRTDHSQVLAETLGEGRISQG